MQVPLRVGLGDVAFPRSPYQNALPWGNTRKFRACRPFSIHNGATAATKSPRADGEAVPRCCYRVLAAASDGPLAIANFGEEFSNRRSSSAGFSERDPHRMMHM